MQHLWPHKHLPQTYVLRDQLKALDHRLPHVHGHVVARAVIYHDHLHQVPLLDHAYHLAAAREGLDALAGEGHFGVIEELPLLESQEDLGIDTLKVFVVGGVLEAELFGLIEDVLP